MAKIKHNNFLNTVNEVFTDAKDHGILHLYAQGSKFSGRTIGLRDRELFHFGTTGYLGLEQDERLKQAAIKAISRYGTQFPLSKSYISHPLYGKLEDCLNKMYQSPILITKNSTLGHLGVIPSAVNDEDAIVLDHQVHWSVQSAAKVLKNRSVPVEMIRHNDLNMLEGKIKSLSNTRKRIWYMADGIYSMYGDYAPVKELKALSLKYPQLQLYFDDVHGMSWVGKNGTGYVLNELKELSENILLFGTLSKTFGASGAVLACSNEKMHKKIKTFGGPLTFSAQLEPASIAAAIASAEIHLSSEIYTLQDELRERTQYFNSLIEQSNLPLIDKNDSPVFYIGTGMPKTGYNFVNRLINEGFYVNLGLFPAVPIKNTGVRITISRHNQKKEIFALVEAMKYHYPKALEDTHTNFNRVFAAFKLEHDSKKTNRKMRQDLTVQLEDTIQNIDENMWNSLFVNQGVFDWKGLFFLEESFTNNLQKEHNWKFKYLIITDRKQTPIVATFFTFGLWKDDMLSKESISKIIEEKRASNPYYLTSNVLSMGSLFTEGTHLYVNNEHNLKNAALHTLMQQLEKLEQGYKAKMVVLRDFSANESLNEFFIGQGFIRIQMPDSCKISLKTNEEIEDYIANLSSKSRRHFRKDILKYEDVFIIKVWKESNKNQLEQIEQLYANVHQNNLGMNTFSFPEKLFKSISNNPNWEFITLSLLESPEKFIGVMLCYKNGKQTYVPAFVGLDYQYVREYHTYRQLLYQTIKRAVDLRFKQIDLGMTASFEKRKLGAEVTEKFAYVQAADNYTLELLGIIERQE
tara:strand:- start:621 stop:3029 length:2409 start_codon:yes stop_codon:yes gene_type:complete